MITKQQMTFRILLTILITAMLAVPTGALMQSNMGILPSNTPVAVPAPLPPTDVSVPTAAPLPTFPPTPTLTPSFTPTPAEIANQYLAILNALADEGKTWVQLDGQIPENTPVVIVDLRKKDGEYVAVSAHFNPKMQAYYDRDLGNNWNGANKNGNEYERLAFAYSDGTLPTLLKVGACKLAYNFYKHTAPIDGDWEVEMNVGPLVEATQDDRGFVKLLDVFKANPNFDCDGHDWNFAQTPTPVPTATITPTPKP